MKRKSGLHKKVSSIFAGTSLPDDPSAKTPLADNDAVGAAKVGTAAADLPASGVGGHTAKPQYQHHTPATGPAHKTVAKVAPVLTEDREYAASQKRKLFLVIGLCVVLALVFFFNFYQTGEKTAANPDMPSDTAIAMKVSEIYWPEPELWPADIRDPMVFKADAAKLYALESKIEGPFVLRGIVHQPQGSSSALIGTEILYEGDEIDGWTVKEVLRDIIRLEKPDGEKLELKMEDR